MILYSRDDSAQNNFQKNGYFPTFHLFVQTKFNFSEQIVWLELVQ